VGLGDKISMPDGLWPVVGVFKTNDDLVQSQLVADSDTVMPVLRQTAYTSVTVRLGGANALAMLKRSITTNPALKVKVERQSDYFNRSSAQFSDLNDALVYGVGVLLGLGALLAAVNILYSAVMARSARSPQCALGFGAVRWGWPWRRGFAAVAVRRGYRREPCLWPVQRRAGRLAKSPSISLSPAMIALGLPGRSASDCLAASCRYPCCAPACR
jgi:hypothetical protein